MARVPGTETHSNRDGHRPGDAVRCRRSRANADLGLADRCGVVGEVRPGNVRLLLDARGASTWLPNEAVVSDARLATPDLQLLGGVLRALQAERVEFDEDEDEIVVYSPGFAAAALDEVRGVLGARLLACSIRAAGVHELAAHLRWHRDPARASRPAAGRADAGPLSAADL